jgi:hypothetical protein
VAEKLEETELSLEQSQSDKEALESIKTELEIEIERLKLLLSQKTDGFVSFQETAREENDQQLNELRAELSQEVLRLEGEISDLKLDCLSKEEVIVEQKSKFDKSFENKQEELNDVRGFLQSDVSRLEKEIQEILPRESRENKQIMLLNYLL